MSLAVHTQNWRHPDVPRPQSRTALRDPGAAPSLSLAPFQFAAAFGRLRLSIFQEHGAHADAVRVASLGSATLLRCESVPDLNTVYAPDERVADRLDLVEAFFRGSPHGCHLVAATRSTTGRLANACERRGWTQDDPMAWSFTTADRAITTRDAGDILVRRARVEERDDVCRLYARTLGASMGDAAVAQLRHLFGRADLSFLVAYWRGRPAGVGVLYHVGSSALLCESRVLSAYRGLGGQRALLEARVRLARSLGCVRLYGGATFGGTDHAEFLRAGMRTVRTTMTWRLAPAGARGAHPFHSACRSVSGSEAAARRAGR